MWFRVLGALEIRVGEDWVRVDRPRRRALLAYLLLAANRTVTTGELTEAIWGPHAPSTAHSQIQNDVAAIRKVLAACGEPATIVTRTGGYELRAAPDDIDHELFRRQVSAARNAAESGDPSRGARALDEAVALWHGPALADVVAPFAEPARARLEEQRLDATERLAEARIALGDHEDQIPTLRELVATHPTRERPAALLMLALHQAGRRAEALAVARDARAYLREHHGLDPSPTLVETERRVMRDAAGVDEGPLPSTPRQLPADVLVLAGRDQSLAELTELAGREGGSRIVVLTGTGGVGKTAVAVRWGHLRADHFPDGAIFVDLRGYDRRQPLTALQGLHRALTGMGVTASRLPSHEDDASALFRSLTADGRYLVVLDNARSPDQVRPLLPGGGSCFVLITSRDRLPGLAASHSVARIELPVLSGTDGLRALEEIIGRSRVAAEPSAATSLVNECGRLPLAIRIVAAQLLDVPQRTLDRQVRVLREDRLSALSNRGEPSTGVRSVLRISYATLPPPTQRLFRLLAPLPYVAVDSAIAAAADGRSVGSVRADLDRLVGIHLLERRGDDHYGYHDLPRAFAAEEADRVDAAADRTASVTRVLVHLGRGLDDASRLLHLPAMRLVDGASHGAQRVDGTSFATTADARDWLGSTYPHLLASVPLAHEHGLHGHAWRLAASLRGHQLSIGAWHDLSTSAAVAIAAATADGTTRGEALARLGSADALRRLGRHRQAIAEYDRALRLAVADDWLECQAACLGNLGLVHRRLGRLSAASDCFTRDLEICRKIGWTAAEAVALGNLGVCAYHLGRHTEATAAYERSAVLARRTSSTAVEALACLNGGISHVEEGDPRLAHAYLVRARTLLAGLGRTDDLILTHVELARLRAGVDRVEAHRHLDEAKDLARRQGADSLDPSVRVQLDIAAAAVLAADDVPSAVTELERAVTRAEAFGLAFEQTKALVHLSALLHQLGRIDGARRHALTARRIAERSEFHGLRRDADKALAAVGES